MIHTLTSLQLRDKLRAGELSSVEVITALLERADKVQSRINAYVHRFGEGALARAEAADAARARGDELGPLHGLPVTIKESIATQGVPCTMGLKKRLDQPQAKNAAIVDLLERAGAVVIGKTNVGQLLLSHESENPIWGAVRNPWNVERVPGGSSGGEAAAIAAGASVLGVGTDIGGSIRVPAAFCGIYGLKPTVDRWSNVGCYTALMGQEVVRGQCGPMARSAADLDLLFRSADSPLHCPFDPAVPPVKTADPRAIDISALRVGFYEDDGFLTPAASLRRAVGTAASALEDLGCNVVSFAPSNAEEVVYTYYAALSSDGGATVSALLQGEEVAPQLRRLRQTASMPTPVRGVLASIMGFKGERRVKKLLQAVRRKPLETYWQLTQKRTDLRRQTVAAWNEAEVDVVLCPAHATPAPGHRQTGDFTFGGCYSMRYNFLNFPAGVVPVGRVRGDETTRPEPADRFDRTAAMIESGTAGLPTAIQVVARPYREDLVLAVMMALERVLREREEYPVTPVDPG